MDYSQAYEHYDKVLMNKSGRIVSIAERMNIDPKVFTNDAEGFAKFNEMTQKIINTTNNVKVSSVDPLKVGYYVQSVKDPQEGVLVILYDGKIQSVMPSDYGYFMKLK